MKKMTLLALLLCISAVNAQISFEGIGDFTKLVDLTYDATIPNRIYSLTNNNHLVVSDDNGASWSLKYTFPDSRAYLSGLKTWGTSSLSFIVNGTYSQQDGIYIIDPATNTVQQHFQVPGVSDGATIISYDIYQDGQTVLAHTTFNESGLSLITKVFYSVDSGQHWDSVYDSDESDYVHVLTVAISPASPSKLFIGRNLGTNGVDGGLLISGDGGENWTEKLPGNTFQAIAFNPSNADDILTGTGFGFTAENLYRSLDGGATWAIIPVEWNDIGSNYITRIAFHPNAPQNIIVLEENEILTSANNGLSWNKVAYPQYSEVYSFGTNASFSPTDAAKIAISCGEFSRVTVDGAVTLIPVRAPYYPADSAAYGKNSGVGQLYHGASSGRISKDLTTGISTAYDTAPLSAFINVQNYIFADPAIQGRIFSYASAGLLGGNLTVSTDYGATITLLGPSQADDVQEIAIDPANSNIIYVAWRSGADGELQKINFENPENIIPETIATPILGTEGEGTGVITGVSLTPGNPSEIYIAKRSKFLKSSDGGLTWDEKINGLPGSVTVIFDMKRNPLNPGHFTLATNAGIYSSPDAGENWQLKLAGNGFRKVKYSPYTDGILVVSSHTAAGGIAAAITYTADSGNTWNTVSNEDLSYLTSYWMDYNFRGSEIDAYIATPDLGVVKYTITGIVLGLPSPVSDSSPFVVYPNPASSEVTIGKNSQTPDITTISIYTLGGKKVMESTSPNINVAPLAKGLYLITVETENGKRYVQKLIKQ